MGFSAMLAEEYPGRHIAHRLRFGLNEHNWALEYTLSFLSLLSDSTGRSNTEYQHSRKPWPLAAIVVEVLELKWVLLIQG